MSYNLSPAKIRERAGHPNTLVAFSNEEALIVAQAIEIADAAARCDIESFCHPVDEPGADWWDPRDADEGTEEQVSRLVDYLESRGLLERHPEQPWVRIKEPSA